jgi:L-threonylcarbamoyladenylate synthase
MAVDYRTIGEQLKEGATMLYPTDTIWGLGCDATNEKACAKLLELKNRPSDKSFIVLVDSIAMLERYVPEFHEVCYDLIDYAVRPLTIIYPISKGLAPNVLAADGSVGIRVTNDPICRQLIRSIHKPIVSTSANLSGEPSPKNFSEINPAIKAGVDVTIEERINEQMTQASQIIRIGLKGEVTIIRS